MTFKEGTNYIFFSYFEREVNSPKSVQMGKDTEWVKCSTVCLYKSQRTNWTKQDKTSFYYYVSVFPLGSSTMICNISASMSNKNSKYLKSTEKLSNVGLLCSNV